MWNCISGALILIVPRRGVQVYMAYEAGHGRLEQRKRTVTGDVKRLTERHPKRETIRSTGVKIKLLAGLQTVFTSHSPIFRFS
jgi:hypothetical protein